MAFFKSATLSALGSDTSAPVGSSADIRYKCWWEIWYEKGHVV